MKKIRIAICGYVRPEFASIDDLVNYIGKKEKVYMTFKLTEKGLLFDENYFSVDGLKSVLAILEENKKS